MGEHSRHHADEALLHEMQGSSRGYIRHPLQTKREQNQKATKRLSTVGESLKQIRLTPRSTGREYFFAAHV